MSKVNTLCSICECDVNWECEAIQCDGCEKWIHRDCANMSLDEYNRVGGATSIWICGVCGLANISTSLFGRESLSSPSYFSPLLNEAMTEFTFDSKTHTSEALLLAAR